MILILIVQGPTEAADDDLDDLLDSLDFRPPVHGVEEGGDGGAVGGAVGPGDGGAVDGGAVGRPQLRSSLNPTAASTPIGITAAKAKAKIVDKKDKEKKINKEHQ